MTYGAERRLATPPSCSGLSTAGACHS